MWLEYVNVFNIILSVSGLFSIAYYYKHINCLHTPHAERITSCNQGSNVKSPTVKRRPAGTPLPGPLSWRVIRLASRDSTDKVRHLLN